MERIKNLFWVLLALIFVSCSSSDTNTKYDAESPRWKMPDYDYDKKYDGTKYQVFVGIYGEDSWRQFNIDSYILNEEGLTLYGYDDTFLAFFKKETIESLKIFNLNNKIYDNKKASESKEIEDIK